MDYGQIKIVLSRRDDVKSHGSTEVKWVGEKSARPLHVVRFRSLHLGVS